MNQHSGSPTEFHGSSWPPYALTGHDFGPTFGFDQGSEDTGFLDYFLPSDPRPDVSLQLCSQTLDVEMQAPVPTVSTDHSINDVNLLENSSLDNIASVEPNQNVATRSGLSNYQGKYRLPETPAGSPLGLEVRAEPSIIEPTEVKRYSCTWCTVSFRKAGNWKRHEESQHAPLSNWVCMPFGPVSSTDESDCPSLHCVMCNLENPSNIHRDTCQGKIAACIDRPLKERTFRRRDKAIQHLQDCHGFPKPLVTLPLGFKDWKRPLYSSSTEPLWSCGLCSKQGMTWSQRCSHIIEHVRNGRRREDWRQCICTKGFPRQLFASAPVVQQLLSSECRWLWTCGYNLAQNSTCSSSFESKDAATKHFQMHHLDLRVADISYRFCCRGFEWPFEGEAVFWCGFCRSIVVEANHPGSYDCKILHHIRSAHVECQASPQTWSVMSEKSCYDLSSALRASAARHPSHKTVITEQWITRAVLYNKDLVNDNHRLTVKRKRTAAEVEDRSWRRRRLERQAAPTPY